MKPNRISLLALVLIVLILIAIRLFYLDQAHHILEWDSLGYYLYLPSWFIYHDIEHLKWWPELLSKYNFPGIFFQASIQENGNYVFFYTMGVALLQMPFFFVGHWSAGVLGYSQDGFSFPYQLSVCTGMIFYVSIGLLVLRKILLRYFNDTVTAWTLILITLASNYPQYTSIDVGFTHGYLFTMCCLLMYFTIRWHDNPTIINALLVGLILGFIAIIRITDAVMLFIPVLWNTHTKELRSYKCSFIKNHSSHLATFLLGVFLSILPQLIYWKEVTGNWVHKMGSKWDFLFPHLRVLWGWEKGWFIYTPVTLMMVAGLFFLKKKDYKRSIITYFLLNVWIITAWHQWRYSASYSARALTQSLAIMSIPLGVFLEKFSLKKSGKIILVVLSIYLCGVNLFQIWQYNKTIIHYDDMNRLYYAAVYLNPSPSPKDMSLLDTEERMQNENNYTLFKTFSLDSVYLLNGSNDSIQNLIEIKVSDFAIQKNNKTEWLKLSILVKSDWGAFDSYLVTELINDSLLKKREIRMHNGICDVQKWNRIEYDFCLSNAPDNTILKVYCRTTSVQNILVKDFEMNIYKEK